MTVRSVISYIIVFAFIAFLTFAAGVEPSALTPIAFVLTIGAWLSFLVLGRAALRRPRIGALTERAFIALVIAALGTVSFVIVLNTDSGHAYFPTEVASLLFRLAIIAVLAVPTLWLVLWFAGRLGQDADAPTDRTAAFTRIEGAIAENTRISQEASDHADAAYHEANSVNEKIAAQGAAIVTQGEATEATAETISRTAGQVDDIHHATVDPKP